MDKCIVQNCKITKGITFPTDDDEKLKWMNNLNLDSDLNEKSFVCLDHFRQCQAIKGENSGVINPLDELIRETIPYVSKNGTEFENQVSSQEKEDKTEVCRLCAKEENLERSIYDSISNHTILNMITSCCYPLTIAENDDLPKMICLSCLQQLEMAYKFRGKCLEINNMWHHKQKLINKKRKQDDDITSTCKKLCRENMDEVIEIDCQNQKNPEISNNDSALNEEIETEKNEPPNSPVPEMTFSDEPPPLIPIEKIEDDHKTLCEIYVKEVTEIRQSIAEDTVEEGTLSIPLAMKDEPSILVLKKEQVIKAKDNKDITLSKDTKMMTNRKYESKLGVHSCLVIQGLQESVFVLADEYLFTFGLLKGDIRYLRCILPNCKAKAEQKLLEGNKHDDKIRVKVAHSHRPPNDQLRKKHMFFHVMRKRMQHDKTLNIRSIYEQVCTQEPAIRELVPLRNVINEICKHQVSIKLPRVTTFEEFYNRIEDECFEKLHFTNSNKQFYQEKFQTEDGCMAIVFCNSDIIENISDSTLMYVDASFKLDSCENFKYQLVTVLVWTSESYYPILFALVNKKTQDIFRKVFQYLHDVLAPNLRPNEIVTDYEANVYYALGETYLDAHIGGSVFYYTQNLYKKICLLNLSRDLEINSNFRNLYHMLLMLPLLPVNTITDALNNIELQAKEMQLCKLTKPIFEHIRSQWIMNVTTDMFCVHRLENRINENVIAPFKKLRDYLLLFKGKVNQTQITVGQVVEKLIELESFLFDVYSKWDKKSFGRDLSSFQKKNVVRAWQYIETHPKININNFFQKVLGYIKCMENQLWIWGFYRYRGDSDDVLISGATSTIYIGEHCNEDEVREEVDEQEEEAETEEAVVEYIDGETQEHVLNEEIEDNPTIVMEAVIDNDGGVVLQSNDVLTNTKFEKAFFKYIRYE